MIRSISKIDDYKMVSARPNAVLIGFSLKILLLLLNFAVCVKNIFFWKREIAPDIHL